MDEVNKHSSQKIRGILQSEKKGVRYDLLFDYYRSYHPMINANVYCFEIFEKGREEEAPFHVVLKIMENGTDLKVIDLYPPDSYKGKGISVALILKARELFNKRIISSSNKSKTEIHEARRDDATEKVWKPLVRKGIADYNSQDDYFFTL